MKSVLRCIVVAFIAVPAAGCYTELATLEQNDREYAYDADTTIENGNTTINNHYYLDDSYRRSRLRVSFHYYYPTYSSWIGSYYFSYFDDPYWGMYHRPSWYYDPFYTYYPPYGWCYYPSPYYDPWYPYYPPVAYYPGYYPSPIYGNNPAAPNRPRTGGSTRDLQPETRDRPIPSPIPVTEIPAMGKGTEVRPRDRGEAIPVESADKGKTPERPWWEKLNTDRPSRTAGEAQPTEIEKRNRTPRENVPANNPPVKDRPNPSSDDRPIDRPKNNAPTYTPPKNERQGNEAKSAERPKRAESRYSPPVKHSVPNDGARTVERPRQTRQPSYNPPRQSAPPQSAQPRSGGGSSSGGNGRKRD